MNTHRCSCCGRTNDHKLVLYPECYTPGPFHKDPYGKYEWDEICDECLIGIADYSVEDEKDEIDELSSNYV